MRKAAFIAVALALVTVNFAAAQSIRFGSSNRGGYRGDYDRGYDRGGARLYVGPGYLNLNSGRYNLDFGRSNYYDRYDYDRYGRYDSRYYWGPSYPRSSYYYYPSDSGYYSPSDSGYREAGNSGRIEVVVPDPNAEVTFNGVRTSTMGQVRTLNTPPLDPNYSYSYKVQATWNEDGKTVGDVRTVEVSPGRTTVVDFTRPAAGEPSSAPAPRVSNQD